MFRGEDVVPMPSASRWRMQSITGEMEWCACYYALRQLITKVAPNGRADALETRKRTTQATVFASRRLIARSDPSPGGTRY